MKPTPLAQVHLRLERVAPELSEHDRRAFVCVGLLGLNLTVDSLTELLMPEVQRLFKALCIPDKKLVELIAEWKAARAKEQISLTDLLEVAKEYPEMPECFAEAALEYQREKTEPASPWAKYHKPEPEPTPPPTDAEILIEILMGYAKHLTPNGQVMRREALQKMNWFGLQHEARTYCLGKSWRDFEARKATARAWELLGVEQEEIFA